MKYNANVPNDSLIQIQMDVLKWLANGRVGNSSKTIACAMAEIDANIQTVPSDPSDFIRCMKMLEACPSIKNLDNVKEKIPSYAPFIDNWDEMVSLLEADHKIDDTRAPTLYAFMHTREAEHIFLEGRILNGTSYIEVADFETYYDVTVTIDNIHDLAKQVKTGELKPAKLLSSIFNES
jgi:hypothetical protein